MKAKTVAPEFSECPYCAGKELTEVASEHADASVTRVGHVFLGSSLIYVVCLQCGAVIHTRVKNIESLLTREEKEKRK